ncbi:MAG: ParB N-terminal domain-containing protein [Treponema sp.]|jgi:ParB family chromosome partitioning protein|nr:ParB N-terminal domain-containing protein [Treponema sp.]
MAKLKAPEAAGWNAGKNYYAKMMRIEDVIIDSEIARIFKMSDETREEIARNIVKKGFDKSQPLVLWKDKNIILDGHTRLAAAKEAGLLEIPVVEKEFEDRGDAILYTFERQVFRRNLTPAEIIQAVQMMDGDRARKGEGKTADHLADRLGVSAAHIYQTKNILKKASDEDIEAVKNGTKSTKEVYLAVNPPKQTGEDLPSLSGRDHILSGAVILLAEAGERRAAILLTEHFYKKSQRDAFIGRLPEKTRQLLNEVQTVPV